MLAMLIRNLLVVALVAFAWVALLDVIRDRAKPLLVTAELHQADFRCVSTRPLAPYPPERQRNTHMSRDKGFA